MTARLLLFPAVPVLAPLAAGGRIRDWRHLPELLPALNQEQAA